MDAAIELETPHITSTYAHSKNREKAISPGTKTNTILSENKMKYWNELEGSTFLNKIYSKPIEIGKIALFSLRIENYQPSINLGFDIPEFPDILPEMVHLKEQN